jgi:hypothetical protein
MYEDFPATGSCRIVLGGRSPVLHNTVPGDGRRLQVVRKQGRDRFAAVDHSVAMEIEYLPETSAVCPEMTGVRGSAVD